MAVIEAKNLTKRFRVADKKPGLWHTLKHFVNRRYRLIEAVREVSFSIEPGEIVGFLGPNGAGKTTTLKMLTGLIHPSAGRVAVVGQTPFQRRHDFLHQITLVMGQKQQLIWDLPAMDSLKINASIYRIDPVEATRRIDELAGMLDLGEELQQPVRKLSLGQRMKAELLAALLHRPRVLFLDEPTLGLDINAQASVRDFLRAYNRQYKATILLTSHYMADITALCPRVMLIHEGKLMFDGSLDALSARFAPYRELNLEFRHEIAREQLESYGEVESAGGHAASLIVPRDRLTHILDELRNGFDVVDFTVTDPPIEQVIGRLFRTGSLEAAAL